MEGRADGLIRRDRNAHRPLPVGSGDRPQVVRQQWAARFHIAHHHLPEEVGEAFPGERALHERAVGIHVPVGDVGGAQPAAGRYGMGGHGDFDPFALVPEDQHIEQERQEAGGDHHRVPEGEAAEGIPPAARTPWGHRRPCRCSGVNHVHTPPLPSAVAG